MFRNSMPSGVQRYPETGTTEHLQTFVCGPLDTYRHLCADTIPLDSCGHLDTHLYLDTGKHTRQPEILVNNSWHF